MTVLTRLSRAPGVRRLVKKRELPPGAERLSTDDEDDEPTWCFACGRQALFDEAVCVTCDGEVLNAAELSRRRGTLPTPPSRGPAAWRLPPSASAAGPAPEESRLGPTG